MGVTVHGVPQAKSQAARVLPVVEDRMQDALTQFGSAIARDAANRVHVQLGDLKRAIGYVVHKRSAVVGIRKVHVPSRGHFGTSTAHEYPHVYGVWEENGWRYRGGHPFMRPAAETERGRFPHRLTTVARHVERDLSVSGLQ